MPRHNWSRLNKQQVGAYAEYFVKMELTMHGFQVYSTEVDDRGIDFVARLEDGPFLEIQVKSRREPGYVFMYKANFPLRKTMHLALVLLAEGVEPQLFLIPSTVWNEPTVTFVDRRYEKGQRSKPAWGIYVTERKWPDLHQFRFEAALNAITSRTDG